MPAPPFLPPFHRLIAKRSVIASRQSRTSRVMSTIPTQTPMKKKNLFETLPLDVVTLLGKLVSSDLGKCYENVCNLAQVSSNFNLAMLEACGYALDAVGIHEYFLTEGYLKMFTGLIKELHMHRLHYYEQTFQSVLVELLQTPTLQFASIEGPHLDSEGFLPFTSLSTSLRELHVTISTWQTVKELKLATKNLDLETLRICCDGDMNCIYDEHGTGETWKQIGVNCPNLKSLDLACICEFGRLCNNLTFLINNLQNLKTLKLGLPDMEHLVGQINLDCLTLRIQRSNAYGCVFQAMVGIASRWPLIVNGIEMDPRALLHEVSVGAIVPAQHEAIPGLRQCTGLQVLHLGLLRGAEESLPDFESLRALHLRFVSQYDDGTGVLRVGNREGFYTMDTGFFERVVRTGVNIKSLGLYDIEIGREALNILLEGIGDRLEEFGVSIWGQEDGLIVRLLVVLEMLGKYNSGLKKILGFPTGCHMNDDGWWIDGDWCQHTEEKLVTLINALKRKARKWDWKHFVEFHGVEEIVTREKLLIEWEKSKVTTFTVENEII